MVARGQSVALVGLSVLLLLLFVKGCEQSPREPEPSSEQPAPECKPESPAPCELGHACEGGRCVALEECAADDDCEGARWCKGDFDADGQWWALCVLPCDGDGERGGCDEGARCVEGGCLPF